MTTAVQTPAPNRPLAAMVAITGFAIIIGFTDNFVREIAADAGLWQFHATRTAMALVILALVAAPLGLRLRPVSTRAVAARSVIHGTGMLFYFGGLAFLPVAVVAAGLFTAPIFVLLISRFAFGHRIGPFRIAAVAIGFAGVILVLGPADGTGLSLAGVLPVLSGALYALGNVATREWCGQERTETLVLGFFLALGVYGLLGLAMLAVLAPEVPPGADGFILRGAVWPTPTFLWWTFVQAAGSLVGVGMAVRAYQLAEASRVAVFEYIVLPASALWSWLLWGELLSARAMAGMVLIFAAGLIIALRAR